MPQPLKLVFTNTWLLKPVLLGQLLGGHSTAAMVRTTTAATMIEGSPKDNVLPQRARAAINFRVLPGDTTEQVLAHVRAAVDDPQVKVSAIERSRGEATPISAETAASFVAIARTVRSLVPGAVVAPALMLGQSDSRHFVQIASQTYRFMPAVFRPEDLDRTHGTNERISIANYADSIRFYGQLLRTVDDEK
jgi:carboxypeptidase PM20D1